jgi:hypothetical protein
MLAAGVMSEAGDAIDPEVEGYQLAIRRNLDREIERIDRTFRIIREADG